MANKKELLDIIAGFDSLKEVGQDFKIQTWTMKQVGGQNIILLAYKLNKQKINKE